MYINDLPTCVVCTNKVRLYTDNVATNVNSKGDCISLQKDLTALELKWQMLFATKNVNL